MTKQEKTRMLKLKILLVQTARRSLAQHPKHLHSFREEIIFKKEH